MTRLIDEGENERSADADAAIRHVIAVDDDEMEDEADVLEEKADKRRHEREAHRERAHFLLKKVKLAFVVDLVCSHEHHHAGDG